MLPFFGILLANILCKDQPLIHVEVRSKNLNSIYEEETMKKKTMNVDFSLVDTEGRRRKIDRRQFTYLTHIPERRSGKDRRSAEDSEYSKTQRRFSDVTANLDYKQGETKRE